MPVKKLVFRLYIAIFALAFSSCSKMGYGILLWSIEDPPILSGTVLPVYIRSNIDHVYVVGVPESSRKIEVPLTQFEFSGSKRKALKRAEEFARYAPLYAENMQDGLPIRSNTDNNAPRVYRLRLGEIIKILEKVDGNPPIGTTGEPLPGDWYHVLTSDGVTGYCFSYRLKILNHNEGALQTASVIRREEEPDPDLDMVLSRRWSPDYYQQMINSRRINIAEFEKKYGFDPGQDSGVARIYHPEIEKDFIYESIVSDGERAWRFEGSDLQMNLRTNTTLAVQFLESTGLRRTLLFNALTSDIDDIILLENARRETQFMTVYNQGPIFTSSAFGTITFTETGEFTWTGFDLLIPQHIPAESAGQGRVFMDIFLSASFAERYSGAFTFRFTDVLPNRNIVFMYTLDNQGLRMEVVPEFGVEDSIVTRRDSSPMVMYFFKDFLP